VLLQLLFSIEAGRNNKKEEKWHSSIRTDARMK
jgi:hypothetical protein